MVGGGWDVARVSNGSGFWLRAIVSPVHSSQFRTIARNEIPIRNPNSA